jgi:hypothetical protein
MESVLGAEREVSMNKRFLAAVGLGSLLVGGVTIAVAEAGGERIVSCANEQGYVRIVDKPEDCRARETVVTWNERGPAGPQGAPGASVVAYDVSSNWVFEDSYFEGRPINVFWPRCEVGDMAVSYEFSGLGIVEPTEDDGPVVKSVLNGREGWQRYLTILNDNGVAADGTNGIRLVTNCLDTALPRH